MVAFCSSTKWTGSRNISHCPVFRTAASITKWGPLFITPVAVFESNQLSIIGLVSRYLTNYRSEYFIFSQLNDKIFLLSDITLSRVLFRA